MTDKSIIEAQILKALSDIYVAVHVFNLKDNSYLPFKTNKYLIEWVNEYPNNLQKQSDNVVMKITEPEHIEKMLIFVNLATLDERLKGKHSISEVFKGKMNGWCRARFTVVDYDEDGKILHVIYSVECINEEKLRERQLMYLSQTDLMTDICNRGYGEKIISEYLEKNIQGMFFLLDVDNFKRINDRYGHDAGDKVLIAIADVLKLNKRSNDIVMRLGGDEFAAYFVGIDTKEKADKVFKRLFKSINAIDVLPEKESIKVSVGTFFYRDDVDFDYIYKEADKGVYLSKKEKDNSVHFGEI